MNFIKYKNRLECTKPLFKKCKILPIDLTLQLNSCKTLWKAANSLLCPSLDPIFHFRSESLTFFTPYKRLDITQNCLPYAGVRLWNTIPHNIRSSPSLSCFKNNLKAHLLSHLWAHSGPPLLTCLSRYSALLLPPNPLDLNTWVDFIKYELHVTITHHCLFMKKKFRSLSFIILGFS